MLAWFKALMYKIGLPFSWAFKGALNIIKALKAALRSLVWFMSTPIRWGYSFVSEYCDPYLHGVLKRASLCFKVVQAENLRFKIPALALSIFYALFIFVLAVSSEGNGYVPVIISTKDGSYAQALLGSNIFVLLSAICSKMLVPIGPELIGALVIFGFLLILLIVLLGKAKVNKMYNVPIGVITGKLFHLIYGGVSRYSAAAYKESLVEIGGILVLKNDETEWVRAMAREIVENLLKDKAALAASKNKFLDLTNFNKEELVDRLMLSGVKNKGQLEGLCSEYLNSIAMIDNNWWEVLINFFSDPVAFTIMGATALIICWAIINWLIPDPPGQLGPSATFIPGPPGQPRPNVTSGDQGWVPQLVQATLQESEIVSVCIAAIILPVALWKMACTFVSSALSAPQDLTEIGTSSEDAASPENVVKPDDAVSPEDVMKPENVRGLEDVMDPMAVMNRDIGALFGGSMGIDEFIARHPTEGWRIEALAELLGCYQDWIKARGPYWEEGESGEWLHDIPPEPTTLEGQIDLATEFLAEGGRRCWAYLYHNNINLNPESFYKPLTPDAHLLKGTSFIRYLIMEYRVPCGDFKEEYGMTHIEYVKAVGIYLENKKG